MRMTRAELLRASLWLGIATWAGWPRVARAAGLPPALQAQLLGRLAAFDRNFAARAGNLAKIALLHKANDDESKSVATSVSKALLAAGDVAGLRVEVSVGELGDPTKLATRCAAERLAMIWFGPGTTNAMPAVASALAGVDVLTAGASGAHAEGGAVVGLDVEESRPKLVVNLRAAKAQRVSFKPELLKLARVIE